jgi:peptidoglycan/LPS O-acetylase OafA/YrhL
VAALYVVLGHVCTLVDPYRSMQRPEARPEWLAWLMAPLWYGHLAVAAFIVVSGFCLQHALDRRHPGQVGVDWRDFFRRRCRRIMPAYYACLAFSLVVAIFLTSRQSGMPWAQYVPVTWENTLAHVLMIHHLNPEWMYKINGVLWSISIEFHLYLLFPLLAVGLTRRGPATMLAGIGSLTFLLLAVAPGSQKLYPWYALLFLLGMASSRLAGRVPREGSSDPEAARGLGLGLLERARASWGAVGDVERARWALVLGLAATIAACLATKTLAARDACFAMAVAAMLVLGAWRERREWAPEPGPLGRTLAWLGTPRLVALGGFSYSLYLIHHPLLQVLHLARPPGLDGVFGQSLYLFVIGVPVILWLSYRFSLVFEHGFFDMVGRWRSTPSATETRRAGP